MTREERVYVGVEEVRAIRWTCRHCQAAISYPLDQTIRLPRMCPSCNSEGLDDPAFRPEHAPYQRFVDALKALRAANPQTAPGHLQLEFLGENRR